MKVKHRKPEALRVRKISIAMPPEMIVWLRRRASKTASNVSQVIRALVMPVMETRK